MKSEITGITRANEGMQGISWNILGQTYVPKNCTDHSFSWHATLPSGTFVPPHIHPDQGRISLYAGGKNSISCWVARYAQGDAGRFDTPRGWAFPHGIFNKSDQTAKVLVLGIAEPKIVTICFGACTT